MLGRTGPLSSSGVLPRAREVAEPLPSCACPWCRGRALAGKGRKRGGLGGFEALMLYFWSWVLVRGGYREEIHPAEHLGFVHFSICRYLNKMS